MAAATSLDLRRMSVETAPSFDRKGVLFEDAKKLGIPVITVAQLPEMQGQGTYGQVYRLDDLVFKVRKVFAGAIGTQTFYPFRLKPEAGKVLPNAIFIEPCSEDTMVKSYQDALDRATAHARLPKSPNLTSCRGLVYIEELNLWAVAYDYVEGPLLRYKIMNRETILKVMICISKALKSLDKAGYPKTDVYNMNVIMKKDGTPVLFDDLAKGDPVPPGSTLSRIKFACNMLYPYLAPDVRYFDRDAEKQLQKFVGPEVARLMIDSQSDEVSMEKCSWDRIADTLQVHLEQTTKTKG